VISANDPSKVDRREEMADLDEEATDGQVADYLAAELSGDSSSWTGLHRSYRVSVHWLRLCRTAGRRRNDAEDDCRDHSKSSPEACGLQNDSLPVFHSAKR
jgi:hypothetical protein